METQVIICSNELLSNSALTCANQWVHNRYSPPSVWCPGTVGGVWVPSDTLRCAGSEESSHPSRAWGPDGDPSGRGPSSRHSEDPETSFKAILKFSFAVIEFQFFFVIQKNDLQKNSCFNIFLTQIAFLPSMFCFSLVNLQDIDTLNSGADFGKGRRGDGRPS